MAFLACPIRRMVTPPRRIGEKRVRRNYRTLCTRPSFPHFQRQSLEPGSINYLTRPTVAALVTNMPSHRFEHDVLRAMIQHVAPHLLESFLAFYDFEKMISCELAGL